MARTTKQLSGGGKDKFLRGLVEAVRDMPAGAATRVSDALVDGITEVRVRREVWEQLRSGEPVAAPEVTPAAPKAQKAKDKARVAAPVEVAASPPAAPATPEAGFDPFAFSAVALLTRKGKPALAAALDQIERAEDLRSLAQAQHLALDPAMTDVVAIRAAIVAGTERRIAERKAAAS
jgi:hypothetical protein